VVTSNGGRGQNTSLFLRGTESDHVLVLIDGVKAGSASLGTAPFQNIPIEQVEKVEVVRGPRSSLYGSEAIGGVIQIFTRRGGDGLKPSFYVGGGSHNTVDASAGVSGGSDQGWYSVHATSTSTDGYDVCRGDLNAGCFADEPDDDGYDNTSLALRGGGTLGEQFKFDASYLDSRSETEFDGTFQNETEAATQVGHLRGDYMVTGNWNSALLLGSSKDDSDNFLNGAFASRFDTQRDQVSWQNNVLLGKNNLVLGLDYLNDEVDSDTPFEVESRDNIGVFGSFRSTLGQGDLELSLRNDDNEQFGSETTGGIAYGHNLSAALRATAGYGTAFKAPTFNELYFPGFGNPDLTAETSESVDLGLSGNGQNSRWSVNLFQARIDDLIAFDPVTFAPVNIGESTIVGVELASSVFVGDWTLGASLTLQDPQNTGGGIDDGNQLPRRPKEVLYLRADRDFGRWSVGGTLRSQGDSFDDPANQVELDGFNVVDLRAGWLLHPSWRLGLVVNNVFDEAYETAAYYPQDGVNGLVTLRYVSR
jgi:vitamin B12 transporter